MDLGNELVCSICTEILYHPLTLLDCLHTFCGACLKHWFAIQADRAANDPRRIERPADAPIFTCPSCRAGVRDTKPNATVTTLLDMYLAANPGKTRSDEDKRSHDALYTPGSKVLPAVRGRSRAARRADEQERRMFQEARLRSIQDYEQSRSRSRLDDANLGDEAESESRPPGRRRAASASTHLTPNYHQNRDRDRSRTSNRSRQSSHSQHRSTSRSRRAEGTSPTPSARQRRQVEHQSSLRSLMGVENLSEEEIQREIEEFALKIRQEGLLDGLDLQNMDLARDNAFTRRITDAYRRHQEERRRQEHRQRHRRQPSEESADSEDDEEESDSDSGDSNDRRMDDEGTVAADSTIVYVDGRVNHGSRNRNRRANSLDPSQSAAEQALPRANRPSNPTQSRTQSLPQSQSQGQSQVPSSPQSSPNSQSPLQAQAQTRPSQTPTSSSQSSRSDPRISLYPPTIPRRGRSGSASVAQAASRSEANLSRPAHDDVIAPHTISTTQNTAPHTTTTASSPVLPTSVPATTSNPISSRDSTGGGVPTVNNSRSRPSVSASRDPAPGDLAPSNLARDTSTLSPTSTADAAGSTTRAATSSSSLGLPLSYATFAHSSPSLSFTDRTNPRSTSTGSTPGPSSLESPHVSPPRAPSSHLLDTISHTMSPSTESRALSSDRPTESPSIRKPVGSSPSVDSQPVDSSLRQTPVLNITCSVCKKSHIEKRIFYNCTICANGHWNICSTCYKLNKGCPGWYGFGSAGWAKWEKARRSQGDSLPWPHFLRANQYTIVPPGRQTSRPTASTSATAGSSTVLRSGCFCSRCSAWANPCYWHCVVCNDGDWGFCDDCVNQGLSCSHPLQPLSYQPENQPLLPGTPSTAVPIESSTSRIKPFRALTFRKLCGVCHKGIPSLQSRYHCSECVHDGMDGSRRGDYDICTGCYADLVARGDVSKENGPGGWRRCLRGHRMSIVLFQATKDGEKRVVTHDLVGGRRLREIQKRPAQGDLTAWKALPDEVRDKIDQGLLQVWVWREPRVEDRPQGVGEEETGGDVRRPYVRYAMAVTTDVAGFAPLAASLRRSAASMSADAESGASAYYTFVHRYPPEGGVGPRAIAQWAWYGATPDVVETCSDDDGDDGNGELYFPRNARLEEVEDVNGEWFYGVYLGRRGLFPGAFVRIEK